jgi:hypothetical protein
MNQRGELTFLCSELVKVMYEDESWNTLCTTANLEAISASSATLLSDEQPQLWRPIAISVKGHELYGVVDSIEVDAVLGCFIKIKLDAQHRWQKQLFVPDHFFALGRTNFNNAMCGLTLRTRRSCS